MNMYINEIPIVNANICKVSEYVLDPCPIVIYTETEILQSTVKEGIVGLEVVSTAVTCVSINIYRYRKHLRIVISDYSVLQLKYNVY